MSTDSPVLQEEIAWAFHEYYGHFAAEKCYQQMKDLTYWKNMHRFIRRVLSTCDLYQRTKHPIRYLVGNFHAILPAGPLKLVAVHLFDPLPVSRAGVMYVFVVLDSFSKYVKLYPLKRATTNSSLQGICKNYLQDVGKPEGILSDHGTQFTAAL